MSEHKIAQPVGFYEEAIDPELLDLIVKKVESISPEIYEEAKVGNNDNSNLITDTRNSKISWWYENDWVCSIFSHYFNKINREFWEYDLNYLSGIQITEYEPGGHYVWHSDYGVAKDSRYTRKLSATLLVTDPSEYEGGDLEFIDYHGNTVSAPRKRGSIIVFDSRIPHRVTPVTKGKRVSLVAWMLGPKLK